MSPQAKKTGADKVEPKSIESKHSNENVEEIVEEVKSMASTRRDMKQPNKGSTIKAVMDAAKEGREVDYSALANELVQRQLDNQQAALDRARSLDPEKVAMFYRCRRCEGPAIFFLKNPVGSGRLTAKDWFASYKKPDEPWPRQTIPCQTCLAETGQLFGIGVVWVEDTTGWGDISFRLDGAALRRLGTLDLQTEEEGAAMLTATREVSAKDLEKLENARG